MNMIMKKINMKIIIMNNKNKQMYKWNNINTQIKKVILIEYIIIMKLVQFKMIIRSFLFKNKRYLYKIKIIKQDKYLMINKIII